MVIKESDYFNEKGSLVPGFHVVGDFRGRRAEELSHAERAVINYFFTNDDSNVYCATDNMPSQLWALLMGQYARSSSTAKERLLKLFSDLHKKDPEKIPSTEQIAEAIARGKDISGMLERHLLTAGKFIEDYGQKYGHASLRDSGTIRACFEGVSQRATKHLEAAREGAYQEQSTRALPFTVENLGIPLEVRGTPFEKRFIEFGTKASELYSEIMEASIAYLGKTYGDLRAQADKIIQEQTGNTKAKLSEKDWKSAIESKSFDISRSLLPQNMTTSLGMTLTARRFQDLLTEWQSSEFEEMKVLGRAAQIESKKIMPSLMKYGTPSDFYSALPKRRRSLNLEHVPKNNFAYENRKIGSKLIAHTPNIEDLVIGSILLNGCDSCTSFDELRELASSLSPEEKRDVILNEFEGKKPFELVPKSMEVGSFTFERMYDIGAYRDLHRQRGDRQQIAPYTTFSYHMPEEISSLNSPLEERFHKIALEAKSLHDDLKNSNYHSAAEYVPIMANLIRHVATKDPVQCFYEAKLRAQAAGADSYRRIAREEIHQVLDVMPSFKGLVEFDDTPSYPLNRLPEKIRMAVDRENMKRK